MQCGLPNQHSTEKLPRNDTLVWPPMARIDRMRAIVAQYQVFVRSQQIFALCESALGRQVMHVAVDGYRPNLAWPGTRNLNLLLRIACACRARVFIVDQRNTVNPDAQRAVDM